MSHRPQRGTTLLLLLLLVVPLLVHAADGCKLNRLAVLPVTMDGLRPTVEAQINGTPALFTLDSGAFWSMLSPASAQQYALRDCNAGLRLNPHAPKLLDSRGLVNLRRNQLDKAIADYNEALKINPKIAWSLYGRGLAELRKGMTAQGDADIAAAKALAPHLPEFAQRIGVSP